MKMKQKYDPEKVVLDAYEQSIEDAIDVNAPRNPISPERKAELQEAARNTLEERREERTNIRMKGSDLARLREIADREGLGYQTLMASVLHKFATGELVERKVVNEIQELFASAITWQAKVSGHEKVTAKQVHIPVIQAKRRHQRKAKTG